MITKNEVKAACFDLEGRKAPGPDGFSGLFYQSQWPLFEEDFFQLVHGFFLSGFWLRKLNCTNIALIPKVQQPEKITQYHPISLCNFAYKVISKMLINHLKGFLGDMISENQGAFLGGRQIQDNVFIAQEAFHYLRKKKKGRKYE